MNYEFEKEISPETSVHQRVKAIKELSEIVLYHRLDEVLYRSNYIFVLGFRTLSLEIGNKIRV